VEAVALVAAWAAATEGPEALRGPALLAALTPADGAWRSGPVGRCDAELLRRRRALLGDELRLTGTCPACDEAVTLALGVDHLLEVAPADDVERVVEAGDLLATVRAATPDDLAAAATAGSPSAAADVLLRRCARVATRDGRPVTQLSAELGDRVSATMAELDPQADVTLDLSCPVCECRWTEDLDVGTLVWTEVSAEARGLLYDVHRIASAYGWSQQEVLELPQSVRQAYLELVP
jgi:hypothetical protein